MHVECLRSLGRARVRWCGFAMTVAEMSRRRRLSGTVSSPERRRVHPREASQSRNRSPGFWACIDFDCNLCWILGPSAVPCSVQRHRATHEGTHAGRIADIRRENWCKPLHSPYDVTALRSKTRRTRVSAAPRYGASDIYARWRRVGTVSSRRRRDPGRLTHPTSTQAKQ